MKQTTNYQLNQWELTDRVLMEDFNRDNQKLENALTALDGKVPRIATGSYVGTGTATNQNQQVSLEFGFPAKLVVVMTSADNMYQRMYVVRGMPVFTAYTFYNGDGSAELNLTWTETGLSWWCQDTQSIQMPFNMSDRTYYYFAIG